MNHRDATLAVDCVATIVVAYTFFTIANIATIIAIKHDAS